MTRSALLASHSRRRIGPHTQGATDAVHLETLEVAIALEGVGIGRLENRRDEVGAGHYTLIPPGVVHSSWTEDEPLVESVVHLRQRRLSAVAASLGIDASRWPTGSFVTTPDILSGLDALQGGEEEPGRTLAEALMQRHLGPLAEGEPADVDPRLAKVAAIIRSDPAVQRTLTELAALANLSAPHFNRIFKEAYGQPPKAFMRRERLRLACSLLAGTELNLTEVAHTVGLSSSGRLSEAFSSAFACTPTEWRRRHRDSGESESLNALADGKPKPSVV